MRPFSTPIQRFALNPREISGLGSYSKSADSTIRGFCALIRTLPKAARKLWNAAKVRDFNIGVQAVMQPYWYEIALAPETAKAASGVNARIVLTVYAPVVRRKGARDIALGSKKSAVKKSFLDLESGLG